MCSSSAVNNTVELIPLDDVPQDTDALVSYLSNLIEEGRRVAAVQVNSVLTVTNWLVGRAIAVNLLRDGRAEYGKQIRETVSHILTDRFGNGYSRTNLSRMVAFAQQFPDFDEVKSIASSISWSHVFIIVPLKSPDARAFYVKEAAEKHLSVRDLRRAISTKSFERRHIANSRIPEGSLLPKDTFSDPLILESLGLADTYIEKDLESAILRDLQSFFLEFGHGMTFVAKQKRMTVGGDDFYLDLLFFSRSLRRLIAVELKLGKFEPSFKGQMELYLRWLDRNERKADEAAPVGLILCSEADRDQIELLDLAGSGIAVAEYWTELPPKAELEAKLAEIVRDAKERLARRNVIELRELEAE